MNGAQRIPWIDDWKGLLILLVVAGHVLGAVSHVSTGWAFHMCDTAYKVIYFFHMPAFFFIVGCCWKKEAVGIWPLVVKRARRLLVPYLVFGLISCAVLILAQPFMETFSSSSVDGYYAGRGIRSWTQPVLSLLHAGGWPNGRGFMCNSVLWFLPAMFTCTVAYWVLDRAVPFRWIQVAMATLLLVGLFWMKDGPELPWGLSLIQRYLPYIILGRWAMPILSKSAKGECLWLTFIWIGYIVMSCLTPDMRCGYWHFKWHLIFTAMTIVGIFLSLRTVQHLHCRMLTVFGTCSLGIMLFHKFLVLPFQILARPVFEWNPFLGVMLSFLTVFVITSVCVWATWLVQRHLPWALGDVRHK